MEKVEFEEKYAGVMQSLCLECKDEDCSQVEKCIEHSCPFFPPRDITDKEKG